MAPTSSFPRSAPILLLGAASAILQTVALRESIAVLGGNEAVVALLFGAWLTLTAVGAFAVRRTHVPSRRALAAGFVGYAALAPLTLAAARRAVLLLPMGVAPSLSVVALAALLLLAPACVLSGWLFAGLARHLSDTVGPARSDQDDGLAASRAYWLDTVGAAIAGAALALVLLDRLLPFAVIGLATGLSLVAASVLTSRRVRAALALAAALATGLLFAAPLDRLTLPWEILGQRVDNISMSPRGALVVADRQGQTQLLLHRDAILTASPTIEGDELAHLSAAMVDAPHDVLVVGAAPAFSLRALRAQGATRIDEVVGDHRIAQQVRAHAPDAADSGVTIVGTDERVFVRAAAPASYDLVIVSEPAPASVGVARLFSREFYTQVRRILRPGGRLVVAMPGHASYANPEQRILHSTVASTLRSVFPQVIALPADLALYVAGDELPASGQVAQLIATRIEQRHVHPDVATPAWVRETLSAARLADAAKWSSLDVAPGTDVHPAVYRAALDATLSQFDEGGLSILTSLLGVGLLIGLAWARPRSRPVPYSIATTGFAALALQLLLMLVYQAAVGALYRDVALVSALFMGSAGVGTWWFSTRAFSRPRLVAADALQVVAALAVAAAVPWLVARQGWSARAAVATAACVVGAASGVHIAFASRAPAAFSSSRGGTVFAVDLVGAAIASLTIYGIVVPALGLAGAAVAVAAVKATSTVALLLPSRAAAGSSREQHGALPVTALVALVAVATLRVPGATLYRWTSANAFSLGVLTVLAAHLALAFEPASWRDKLLATERRLHTLTARLGLSPIRAIGFVVLLPVAALPIARCYFRVPYVFCHACPRPCTFGLVRPYVVTGALLTNVGDRRFCERVCPLGQAQLAAARARGVGIRRLGRIGLVVRLVVMGAVAFVYFAVRGVSRVTADAQSVFAWGYANAYGVSVATVLIAGSLVALSFVVHRPFCDGACPIGAASDLVARAEKRWVRRRSAP